MKAYKREQTIAAAPLTIKGWNEGESKFLRIESDIKTKLQTLKDGSPDVDKDSGQQKEIHSLLATDLDTGETGQMVLPFLIYKPFLEIQENEDSLVGKMFEIVKGATVNRTTRYSIYRIALQKVDK